MSQEKQELSCQEYKSFTGKPKETYFSIYYLVIYFQFTSQYTTLHFPRTTFPCSFP